MDPSYRALLDRVEDRHAKDVLSPFFRFLSALGIRLEDVRRQPCRGLPGLSERDQLPSGEAQPAQVSGAIIGMRCAKQIPEWPQITLTEPPYAKRFAGPALEEFPQGLRDDIDAYCERISKRHKTVSGRIFRPCKPSTIETRRRELIAAVRAAVAAGIPLEELNSLRDLLRADRVEIIIEHYWQKNGERPSLYTIDLASKLLALARGETLSEVDIERLDEIRTRRRAVPLYRSHREEPQADPANRPERCLARGCAAPSKAHGRGEEDGEDEALQGRRHGAACDRHPDPDQSPGPHAEPRLDLASASISSGREGRGRPTCSSSPITT